MLAVEVWWRTRLIIGSWLVPCFDRSFGSCKGCGYAEALGASSSALASALSGTGASWDGICGEYICMVESVSRSCHLRLL